MPSEGVARERLSELTATQRTLVESLQAFVREASKSAGPEKQEKEELHPLQIIFLIAFAVDITLLYVILLDVFPNIPENRGVVFSFKRCCLPWGARWPFPISNDCEHGYSSAPKVEMQASRSYPCWPCW
jgi:hypothetical protein